MNEMKTNTAWPLSMRTLAIVDPQRILSAHKFHNVIVACCFVVIMRVMASGAIAHWPRCPSNSSPGFLPEFQN